MSGKITHSWNGTVLTITSDAGTSSADLKGNTGCRGPQGPHGVVYGEDGNIVMEGFATEAYVDSKVANIDLDGYATEIFVDAAIDAAMSNVDVDLTDYATNDDLATLEQTVADRFATQTFVTTEIAKVQLEGAGVDTSGFATKDDIPQVDGVTITQNALGVISTAIGGGIINNEAIGYAETGYALENYGRNECKVSLEDASYGDIVTVVITYEGGEEQHLVIEVKANDTGDDIGSGTITPISSTGVDYADGVKQSRFNTPYVFFTPYTDNTAYSQIIVKSVAVYFGYVVEQECVPINAKFIPVDNETIIIQDGKLVCVGGGGTSYPSSEEVEY